MERRPLSKAQEQRLARLAFDHTAIGNLLVERRAMRRAALALLDVIDEGRPEPALAVALDELRSTLDGRAFR